LITLIILAIAAVILIRNPFWGLLILVFASLVIPFSIGTGTKSQINTSILLVAFLTGLWLIDMLVFKKTVTIKKSITFIPILLLSLVALLSFLIGQLPWFGNAIKAPIQAQLGGLSLFWLSTAAFLLTAHQIKQTKQLEWLVWTFLLITGILIIIRINPFPTSILNKLSSSGIWGSMLWVWFVALSLSQLLINNDLRKSSKIFLSISLAIAFFQVYTGMRSWASGWLPVTVTIIVILLFTYPRLGISLSIIGVIIIILKFSSIYNVIMATEEYSAITRWEAWKVIIKMAKENPITGFGPANYYAYSALFPLLGYYVNFNSHSQYFDLLAQTGILGLVFYLWFAAEIFHLGWNLLKINIKGFPKAYVIGVIAGLAGTITSGILGDWVIPFVYNIGLQGFRTSIFPWIFFGGLVSLSFINKEESS